MNPFVAELIGTALLILFGGGVCANVSLKKSYGNGSGWIVITTGWALAVFVGVIVSAASSGAHLNPAVTIALAVAGKFPWASVPSYIAAQFIGAFTGAFMVWLINKDHFNQTEDAGTKLGVFCTGPAIKNTPLNLLSEIVGTFTLIYVIFHFSDPMVGGATGQKIGMGALGALPVTFLVWAIGLSLGGTTGYAINPARDLGPRIIHALVPIQGKGGNNWGYAWIPVLGPIIGAVLAALLYNAVG